MAVWTLGRFNIEISGLVIESGVCNLDYEGIQTISALILSVKEDWL